MGPYPRPHPPARPPPLRKPQTHPPDRAQLLASSERLLAGGARCNPNNVANPERTEYVAGNLLIQEVVPDTGETVMWCVGGGEGAALWPCCSAARLPCLASPPLHM